MNIQCPNCGENLETPCEIGEGQHVLCPCCNAKFEYRAKQTFCPNCAQELVLPHGVDEGQHLKCPYCEKVFTYTSKADCKKRHERFPWGRLLVMSDFLWLSSIKRGAYGRCGRIEYALQLVKTLFWLCMLCQMRHVIIKKNASAALSPFEGCSLMTVALVVVSVVGMVALILASIRRLHDWNKAGWWVLTLIPVSLAVGIVSSLLRLRVDMSTLNGNLLCLLWIAALFFPSVAVNNRFGEAVEFHVPKPKVKHWVLFALITLIKVRILMAAVSYPCAHENAENAVVRNVGPNVAATPKIYARKSAKGKTDKEIQEGRIAYLEKALAFIDDDPGVFVVVPDAMKKEIKHIKWESPMADILATLKNREWLKLVNELRLNYFSKGQEEYYKEHVKIPEEKTIDMYVQRLRQENHRFVIQYNSESKKPVYRPWTSCFFKDIASFVSDSAVEPKRTSGGDDVCGYYCFVNYEDLHMFYLMTDYFREKIMTDRRQAIGDCMRKFDSGEILEREKDKLLSEVDEHVKKTLKQRVLSEENRVGVVHDVVLKALIESVNAN